MKLNRLIDIQITQSVEHSRQIIILTGPRQVGKTTLLTRLFPTAIRFNCDDAMTRHLFNGESLSSLRSTLPQQGLVLIDEIQRLHNPGLVAKLIFDEFPKIQLLITGSAGLSIKNKLSESLAGRHLSFDLYPLTFSEYLFQTSQIAKANHYIWHQVMGDSSQPSLSPLIDRRSLIETMMVYGSYPLTLSGLDRRLQLLNLVESVVFRDLIDLNLIPDKHKALTLLKLLAYQIGGLVNYSDLANRSGLDQRTVKRYLELFVQSYLIYFLYPYHQNERDILSKSPKVYFLDLGLRNAIIDQFDPPPTRMDSGHLWENWLIIEMVKSRRYQNAPAKLYYWRNTQGAEIDLVVQHANTLAGFECKLSAGLVTKAFARRYPQATTKLITPNLI